MEELAPVLLIALAVLFVLFKSLFSSWRTSRATNIPGPAAWPIIGNAGYFIGVSDVQSALQAFTKMADAYDFPLNRVWLGPKLVILVKSPKYIEVLLSHKAAVNKDDFFYKAVADATGNGVFTRKGEAWLRLRKPMTTLLKPRNINNFQGIICQKVRNLCVELDMKTDSGPFNISQVIDDLFVNMWSYKSMLGLKKFELDPELREQFTVLLKKKIDERRTKKAILQTADENLSYSDIVMRTGEIEGMSPEETAMLVSDFYIAGADTQSVVIIVLLYLLAIHQEYQEKIYQELISIFGHSDRDPEEEDLKQMVFLEMSIKEALRHCAPPAVARTVDEDIEIDGYIIPKGAALLFTLYMTLKDPKYWERPEEFYPEHFLPEAVAKRPKGTFLPFVTGPKMCPGQQYSFQAMKTVMSTLLRRYHFTTHHKYSDLKFKYSLMREPVNPQVNISKRLRA